MGPLRSREMSKREDLKGLQETGPTASATLSYRHLDFVYRPDLDGNKLAKGMCLAINVRDREVFI